MPIARDETFPSEPGNLADVIRRRIEPVTRRLPIVGPHTSPSGSQSISDHANRAMDIIDLDSDTRDRVNDLIGPADRPPGAVWTYPQDEMHAQAQPGEAPPPDVLHTRRYDP